MNLEVNSARLVRKGEELEHYQPETANTGSGDSVRGLLPQRIVGKVKP